MGAKCTFNSVTRRIKLTEAPALVNGEYVVTLDVQVDLYSDQKEDWLADPVLRKVRPPFSAIGGNPTPTGFLGDTYFIQSSWKIEPYDADHRLIVNGNLYSVDGTNPYVKATGGSFSFFLESTVSNLVDSTVTELPGIKYSFFNNVVTIDVDNGIAGTGNYNDIPIGTPIYPSNNLADAKVIAAREGFIVINLLTALTIGTGENIDGYTIKSVNWLDLVLEGTVSCMDTIFEKVALYGELSGGWNVIINCWIYNVTNFAGWIIDSCFDILALGPYTEYSGGETFIDNLTPLYPSTAANLTMGTDTYVSFTNSMCDINVDGMIAGSTLDVGFSSGVLTVNSSCTGGDIIVRGTGNIINESVGPTVNTQGLLNAWSTTALKYLIESQLLGQSATGNEYYWDPLNGDDSNPGTYPTMSKKTFAACHALAESGDSIYIVTTTGAEYAIEHIQITKENVHLRGSGTLFMIQPPDDTTPAITITGNRSTVWGVACRTLGPTPQNAIHATGEEVIIHHVRVLGSSKSGIYLNSLGGTIEGALLSTQCAEYGIEIGGAYNRIIDAYLTLNGKSGLRFLAGSGPSAVKNCWLMGNAEYGLQADAGSVYSWTDNSVFIRDNGLGKILNNGAGTVLDSDIIATEQAAEVWSYTK